MEYLDIEICPNQHNQAKKWDLSNFKAISVISAELKSFKSPFQWVI